MAAVLSWAAIGRAQDTTRKPLKKVPVPYPSILRSKSIGGIVRLKVFVKPDGTVRNTEVLGGNPILAESAQKKGDAVEVLAGQLGNSAGDLCEF